MNFSIVHNNSKMAMGFINKEVVLALSDDLEYLEIAMQYVKRIPLLSVQAAALLLPNDQSLSKSHFI
jgi:hypothetical protein